MPLSDHEQRMLDQIESALYAEDPKFASSVRGGGFRAPTARRRLQGGALFVIGLAMLQLLSLAGLQITLAGLIVLHAVYVMPFTVRLIMTGLARFEFSLEDAARSLGAGPARTLWYVTLPLTRGGLIAGFLFAFILSFVNLPLSLFLTNPGTATLPVTMFAYMESRIDPVVAAVASLIVVAAVAITILLERGFRLRLLS